MNQTPTHDKRPKENEEPFLPCPSGSFPITPAQLRELMTPRRRTRASIPPPEQRIRIVENDIEDFWRLERDILSLIVKWTDPDHPEGRFSKSTTPIDTDKISKLESMLGTTEDAFRPKNHPRLPQNMKDSFFEITSNLYAIIETIGDPGDRIWKFKPHPYDKA